MRKSSLRFASSLIEYLSPQAVSQPSCRKRQTRSRPAKASSNTITPSAKSPPGLQCRQSSLRAWPAYGDVGSGHQSADRFCNFRGRDFIGLRDRTQTNSQRAGIVSATVSAFASFVLGCLALCFVAGNDSADGQHSYRRLFHRSPPSPSLRSRSSPQWKCASDPAVSVS